jgi:opacity protein-like surface antigen
MTVSRLAHAAALTVLLSVIPASWAGAQVRRPAPARPAARQPALSIAAAGHAGFMIFSATESFKAVLGSNGGLVFGGGAEVRMRNGLFVGARISRFEKSGSRVFVHDGDVFDLGIPTTVAIMPIETVAGYRFGRPNARTVPYVGGGIGWHTYRESSEFATAAENVDERFTGYHVLAGVEQRVARLVGVAGEVQWTTAPDALGASPMSASAAFGESDLGGIGFRLRVVIGR